MPIRYLLPSPALQPLLSVHAVMEAGGRGTTEVVPALLPNLFVRVAGEMDLLFDDGTQLRTPPVAVMGPTTRTMRARLSPDLQLLTVGLMPAGWAVLLGMPAGGLADRMIDAADLWSPVAAGRLVERCTAAVTDGARTALIEAFLLAGTRPVPAAAATRLAAIDHWLEHSPTLDLDLLCGALDLSARQAGRLALDLYGASPKTLALHGRDGMGEALAPFADQSHLIRDFHRFLGCTPGTFLGDGGRLAAATLAGRARAGVRRPLALLS